MTIVVVANLLRHQVPATHFLHRGRSVILFVDASSFLLRNRIGRRSVFLGERHGIVDWQFHATGSTLLLVIDNPNLSPSLLEQCLRPGTLGGLPRVRLPEVAVGAVIRVLDVMELHVRRLRRFAIALIGVNRRRQFGLAYYIVIWIHFWTICHLNVLINVVQNARLLIGVTKRAILAMLFGGRA